MKEITIKIPDNIQLTAGIITILYEDVNEDMNLQSNNLDFQTGNMNFDFKIKKCRDSTWICSAKLLGLRNKILGLKSKKLGLIQLKQKSMVELR